MRARRFLQSFLTASLALFLVLGMFASRVGLAQDPAPEGEVLEELFPPDNPRPLGAGPGEGLASGAGVAAIPDHGGPDLYGYTWKDSRAAGGPSFSWEDARGGISFLSGDNSYRQLTFASGFQFPFYENTYTSVCVGTNGVLSFGSGATAATNQPMPLAAPPNNLIAAFWDDLIIGGHYNSGRIYVLQPSGPTGHAVIEWYQVTCKGSSTPFSFEVILYANGDVKVQYQSAPSPANSGTVGIEDDAGEDGLTYVYNASGLGTSRAVLFTRPAAAERVKIVPRDQGGFGSVGTTVDYSLYLRNTGNAAASDDYALSQASTWDLELLQADGVTPLASPVTLAQGEGLTITARITIPPSATVGDYNEATITACTGTSCLAAHLRTAVPAPFAQIYVATPDGATSIYLAHPSAQAGRVIARSVTDDWALATTRDGLDDFVAVWTERRIFGPANLSEVWFAVRDRLGAGVQSRQLVEDLAGVPYSTYDTEPVVARAPGGRVGVAWLRDTSTSLGHNYNVYFTVLGQRTAYGPYEVLFDEPINVTKNTVYGPSSGSGAIRFYSPHIAATSDNRFIISWQREQTSGTLSKDDVYVAVYGADGSQKKAATNFTGDTTWGDTGYFDPTLATLDESRVLLAYNSRSTSLSIIRYVILNSSGNVAGGATTRTLYATGSTNEQPAAVQLWDGKILVAWVDAGDVRYKVLPSWDSDPAPVAAHTLNNPAALGAPAYISAVADDAGHGILTWTEGDSSIRANLYYALVDGDGAQVHPAVAFLRGAGVNPRISTSGLGYGAAPFNPPAGTDLWVKGPTVPAAAFGGVANVTVQYGNRGITPATVIMTATLPANVEYSSDTSGLPHAVSPDGRLVTWTLPEPQRVRFLQSFSFTLRLIVTAGDPGTHYQVDLTIAGPETEDATKTGDNTASFQVVVPYRTYQPYVEKQPR